MIKHVRPKEGLKVLNPHTGRPLLPEGEDVAWTFYWDRRLSDGDIEVVTAKASRKQSAKEA